MEDATAAVRAAEEACMQRLDDVEARFEALGMFARGPGIATHARRAIASRFASARVRVAKSVDVMRAMSATAAVTAAVGEKEMVVASSAAAAAARRASTDDLLCFETNTPRDVLKRWIVEHFDAPWPTPVEKRQLAARTGLSLAQVSNFMINARVRMWRPLVMELGHELEASAHRGSGQSALSKGKKRSVAKR